MTIVSLILQFIGSLVVGALILYAILQLLSILEYAARKKEKP